MGLESKIVHRNLKIENLLLTNDPKNYMISDFELSAMLPKNISSEGNFLKDAHYGTVGYMATELFMSFQEFTEKK